MGSSLNWVPFPDASQVRRSCIFQDPSSEAFSVNQHAGICDRAPSHDSLGREITACPCTTPKFLTGEHCEMNKLPDLLQHESDSK